MPRATAVPLPAVKRALAEVGRNVRLARLRRKLSAALLAERAGMSRPTLRSIEHGDLGVSLGALANVLYSLGLEADLRHLARDDELGRKLQDAQLEAPKRAKCTRKRTDEGAA